MIDLKDKSILVTGGTGSFGRKFVKTLLENTEARRVIVFSRDELKQSEMQREFSKHDERLRFFIGDIRDLERLQRAFHGVDYVIHAAALKHVPILEYNPFEAVKTNILGTQNIISAALDQGVQKVVLVSTDKAANPANLYGATKLCAERLMISANAYSGVNGTRFGIVRYGNVFGSRGSLVKILEEQKIKGEVTLTHEEMTRFWITLDQGVNLVLMALEKMHGGEIFIPKIPSMRIKDFIITIAPNCKMVVTGIRPGEKLHEVLITQEEARHTKEFDKYFVILPEYQWWSGNNNYSEGKTLNEGFCYSSLNNTEWFNASDIEKLMSNL